MTVEERLTRVLAGWAIGSLVVGAAAYPRSRGFGRQAALWGAVEGAIALVGARRRIARGPTDPARLRRVLLANAALDVGYLVSGVWLVRDGRWRGDGVAVVLHGGFLLGLDSAAALRL